MTNFLKYILSDSAIKDIATMVTGETGGTDVLACRQEVSQLANLNEVTKKRSNTESDIINTLHCGWYSPDSWKRGVTQTAIDAVRFVLIEGKRVLPRYVTEHDWFPNDIKNAKSRGSYQVGDLIENVYGSKYRFYCFFGSKGNGDIAGYFTTDYEDYKDDVVYSEGDDIVQSTNTLSAQEIIDKLIAWHLSQVGYIEKANGNLAYLADKTANAGSANYTIYGYKMHQLYPATMDYPAAWCDAYFDCGMVEVFGAENAAKLLHGFDDYTVASADKYKAAGEWHRNNPQRGDQIFFKNSSGICHTGVVINNDGVYVYTIEGNTSNGNNNVVANGGMVCAKKYTLDYSKIAGYGRPNYASITMYAEPTWTATPTELNVDAKVITSVNIKNKPFDEADTIGRLVWGDLINIDTWTDNGWYGVYFANLDMYGYVKQSDVELISVDKQDNIEQILFALHERQILSDVDMWRKKAAEDCNIFYLLQNILYYAETKKRGETASDGDYEDVEPNLWEMLHRSVITNADLWKQYMQNDINVYWLIRKAVYYFRTL